MYYFFDDVRWLAREIAKDLAFFVKSVRDDFRAIQRMHRLTTGKEIQTDD